jgi:hypothetical protein
LSPSGRSYEGDWKDGVPGGFGTLKQKDGTVEKGEFKDGKLHGTGTKSQPSTGMEYTGHFYQGTPDGFGKIQLANGDWFEGNWSMFHPYLLIVKVFLIVFTLPHFLFDWMYLHIRRSLTLC